ncbi:alpha/beta hydrolase fold domain-containing protein [Nesterenkonia cremea]|uniref:Esterase n=1 Tax=Nesterenkonia cremea TaxID=1882340 RepID=A0A917ERP0_9MICC|nr:alpha/beta hydrolase [Nesterenkonia cremea]GGE71638.1 esterase [Nesterenkonia cremea]
MVTLPQRAVPAILKLTGRNKVFWDREAAEQRVEDRVLRPRSFAPPKRLRAEVSITREEIRGWPVYTITPRAAGGEPQGSTVFVHGGGWVNEIVAPHWQLAASIAAENATTVTVPIYPLAPRGTAEQVVDGVVALVRESVDRGAETRLFGDSAGGQIALSAALQLRDAGIVLPRTVLLSPALDLTWSNPRIDLVQPSDPWLARPGGRHFSELWRDSLEVTDPRVSPLYGDLSGLGPLSVFIGTRDILQPDTQLLHQAAEAAGVAIDFYERKGEVHVYALLPTAWGRRDRQKIIEALRPEQVGG